MNWTQQYLQLEPKPRGFHLITQQVKKALQAVQLPQIGLLHVYIQHSSASLTINENADPSVRADFESFFNYTVAENMPFYTHTEEGPDDMPAHLKASILGSSITIPITEGKLALGTWQGVYLCEHRDHGGPRKLVLTLQGN